MTKQKQKKKGNCRHQKMAATQEEYLALKTRIEDLERRLVVMESKTKSTVAEREQRNQEKLKEQYSKYVKRQRRKRQANSSVYDDDVDVQCNDWSGDDEPKTQPFEEWLQNKKQKRSGGH